MVYQFEDPEGAASTLDQGVLDGLSDFGNIWGDMRVQVPLAVGCGVLRRADNDGRLDRDSTCRAACC